MHTYWPNLCRGCLCIQMVRKRDQWYVPWATYLPSSMNMSLFQTRTIAFTKALIIHCPLLVVARTLLVHGDLFLVSSWSSGEHFLCQMLACPTCCFIVSKAHLDLWWAYFSKPNKWRGCVLWHHWRYALLFSKHNPRVKTIGYVSI